MWNTYLTDTHSPNTFSGMSKREADNPVKAVRLPKRKRKKNKPKRPPATLPEPVATYEL